MPIEFACESCTKLLRVPDGSEGRACQCPACGTLLEIPDPNAIADVELHDASAVDNGQQLRIPCPKCHCELVCDASLLGTKGQCRNCKYIFFISENPANSESPLGADAAGPVFNCPKCDQLFEGRPEMEGRKGKCHACGEVFAIQLKSANDPRRTRVATPGRQAASELKPDGQQAIGTASRTRQPAAPKESESDTSQPKSGKPRLEGEPSSEQIRIACSKCRGVMEVPVSAAGQTTTCPFCQQLLKIPKPRKRSPVQQTVATPVSQPSRSAERPTQPTAAQPLANPASDIWAELEDLSGAATDSPYAAPQRTVGSSTWNSTSARKKIRGLTFTNAFDLTLQSLFPACLLAPVLFGGATVVAFVSIIAAGWLGAAIAAAVQTESRTLMLAVVFTPIIIVGIGLLFLITAAACMTCNTALHAVRGKPLSTNVLFGTGQAYGGMLVLMLGWTGLNLLNRFGVPYLVSGWNAAGQTDTAVLVGGILLIGILLIQLSLFFMLAFVPFALLDGEGLPGALGTSCSIFFGNFLTVFGVMICGWLLYVLVSVVSCGLGLAVLMGAPLFLYAAIYRLAVD